MKNKVNTVHSLEHLLNLSKLLLHLFLFVCCTWINIWEKIIWVWTEDYVVENWRQKN